MWQNLIFLKKLPGESEPSTGWCTNLIGGEIVAEKGGVSRLGSYSMAFMWHHSSSPSGFILFIFP